MGSIQHPVVTTEDILLPYAEHPIAWLGMHFSPVSNTVTAVPSSLPPRSVLLLDDRVPPSDQNSEIYLLQLESIVKTLSPEWVYLDFQRPNVPASQKFVCAFQKRFPDLCAVSHHYADGESAVVVLPPLPLHQDPQQYILPWKDRPIWVEQAPTAWELSVTEAGMTPAQISTLPEDAGHYCPALCCHYSIKCTQERAVFTLWSTKETLDIQSQLLQTLGVQKTLIPGRFFTPHPQRDPTAI